MVSMVFLAVWGLALSCRKEIWFPLGLDLILYFSQQNVGIIFCIDGSAFLREINMDDSLPIPKECYHYFSSWDCPSWFFGFLRTATVPLFRWLLWLRNKIVNPSFIRGDYGLKKLFTFFFKPSQELTGYLQAYHFVFIGNCAWDSLEFTFLQCKCVF